MKNIAILASGNGTNGENIARFFASGNRIRVALTLTNRRNAGVIPRMESLGIPVIYFPNSVWDNSPEEVVNALKEAEIDLVVLAGFMHYVSPVILDAFPGAVINIHPSLLPAYGGKGMWGHHVHEAVIKAGETESGVTVHYVTDEFDKGEIVMQQRVPVTPDDNAETLESKIHAAEYELYPRAIVKALGNLEKSSIDSDEKTSLLPHAVKSPDEEWADVLKLNFDPSKITPPPVPEEVDAKTVNVAPYIDMQKSKRAGMDEPMPSTYMIWSVLCTLCCCFIPGIFAIFFSSQVSSKYYEGDIEGSWKASERAQIWIIVSFVVGVLVSSLTLPISLIGN